MLTSIRLRYSRFLCNQVLPELAYVASPVTAHQSKRIKQLPKVTSAALQYEAPKMYSDCIAMMCESSHDGHSPSLWHCTIKSEWLYLTHLPKAKPKDIDGDRYVEKFQATLHL